MAILTKEQFANYLYGYYKQHYGERETDEWYGQSAVNVLTFKRDGKYITLKSHILTGEVTERIEE